MRTLLIALAAAACVYVVTIAALFLAGRRTAAGEVATLLPNLLMLFKGLVRDPRVPRGSKMLLIFGPRGWPRPSTSSPSSSPSSAPSMTRSSPA